MYPNGDIVVSGDKKPPPTGRGGLLGELDHLRDDAAVLCERLSVCAERLSGGV